MSPKVSVSPYVCPLRRLKRKKKKKKTREIKLRVRSPGLDLCERGHVVDCLLHVPHLVRIDHEYRAGRTRVLPGERGAA